ncbi:MAG: GspH/FimT family pseudopilin [Gammaproteobacteria bacterium]|nr:GspH/FimT family pseudopilin [Gammaproteobacteria bacterium]
MKRQNGFNLFELMIVVAVLGTMLSIGVPGLQSFILDNRISSQLNLLSSSLALARSEAVKNNQPVVVCVTSDGAACDTSGVTWNTGWLVFIDRNGDMGVDAGSAGTDGCAEGATADCVLAVQAAFSGENTLSPGPGVPNLIAYDGTGTARCDKTADGSYEACVNADTYFTLCDFRGAGHARALSISKTGRSAVLDKKPNGGALTCP